MCTDMVLDESPENVLGDTTQENAASREGEYDFDMRHAIATEGLIASIASAFASALKSMNINPETDLALTETELKEYILHSVAGELGPRFWDDDRGVMLLDTTVIGATIEYRLNELKETAEQVKAGQKGARSLFEMVVSGLSTGATALVEGGRRALRKASTIA